jgi:di/tricarboxylate transporter
LPIAIVGSIGALSLIVTRVITEKQAYQAIDSQTIFLFGGTLALAKRWKPPALARLWRAQLSRY